MLQSPASIDRAACRLLFVWLDAVHARPSQAIAWILQLFARTTRPLECTSTSTEKEGWALTALGVFGNDETARKLTPYIRAWPGEASHARAVAGLEVLATIGSDVALMLLNGVAQKVKFKGLQDRAREKIAQIAETRGFTTEELEDRLAPDPGLDETAR